MDVDTLSGLKYPKLQSLAKKNDVKANQTKDELVDQLARKLSRENVRSSSRRSLKRAASEIDHESIEDEPATQRRPPPIASQTRPSRSGTAPPSTHTRSQSTPRTSSRVVSVVAPRASLVRRSSKPPPPVASAIALRKAKETQRKLGVGRPTAVGGSGARKSTSRPPPQSKKQEFFQLPNHVVEVVMPSLRMLRNDPEAESVASSSKGPRQPEHLKFGKGDGVEARLTRLETDMTKEKRDSIFFHAQVKDLWELQKTVQRLSTLVDDLREECADLRLENETLRTAKGEAESLQMDNDQMPGDYQNDDGNGQVGDRGAGLIDDQTADEDIGPITLSIPPTLEQESSPKPATGTEELPNERHSVPTSSPSTPRSVRASSRTRSSARYEIPSTVIQVMTAPRSRTKSRQAHASPLATIVSDGVNASESGRASPSHPSPSTSERSTKRRRLNGEGDHVTASSSETIEGAVAVINAETMVTKSKGKAATQALPISTVPSTVDTTAEFSDRATVPVRALSQPPWSKKSSQRGGAQAAAASTSHSTRQTRAGSAGPSNPSVHSGSSRLSTLATVGELPAEESPATAEPSEPVPSPARLNLLSLPRIQGSPSRTSFISYPLATDPVKPIKPLTQSDSGSEFFAGVSKQGYQTDWHDGVVFDDPVDAVSARRATTLAVHAELGERGQSPLFSEEEDEVPGVPQFVPTTTFGEIEPFDGMVDIGMGVGSPF